MAVEAIRKKIHNFKTKVSLISHLVHNKVCAGSVYCPVTNKYM